MLDTIQHFTVERKTAEICICEALFLPKVAIFVVDIFRFYFLMARQAWFNLKEALYMIENLFEWLSVTSKKHI